MKTLATVPLLVAAAALMLGASLSAQPVHSAPTNSKPALVSALRAEAAQLRDDARIYQWARVGRENSRLAAEDHKLQSMFPTESEQSAAYRALHHAVLVLRSAAAAHLPSRVTDAAKQVIAACDAVTALGMTPKGN